jgi:hypothetical protein
MGSGGGRSAGDSDGTTGSDGVDSDGSQDGSANVAKGGFITKKKKKNVVVKSKRGLASR